MIRTEAARRALVLVVVGVLALVALFVWVTTTTPEQGGFDARVLELADDAELPGRPSVLSALSSGTNTEPLLVATIIVGIGAWLARARRTALLFWAVSAFSSLAVTVLKRVGDRVRPPFGQVVESTLAWPSGHSAGSLVFALGVGLVAWHSHRHPWRLATLLLVPAALAVGYSRAFFGLHWATDVLGGWLVAGVAAALFVMFGTRVDEDVTERPATRLGWLYGAIIAAVGYLIIVGVMAPPIA